MPWLYVLFSDKDGKFYLGQTQREINVRVAEHQAGYVKATKHRRPICLAYAKEFPSAVDVKRTEWKFKQPSGYREKRTFFNMFKERKHEWPIIEKL